MNSFATKLDEIRKVLSTQFGAVGSYTIYNNDLVTVIEDDHLNTYTVFCEALAHLVDEAEVILADGLYILNVPDPDGDTELDKEYEEYLNGLSAESRASVERMSAKTGEELYEVPAHDAVNHPSHYTAGRKYETIDVIEDWDLNFHLAQVIKYVSRAGRKGNTLEDLNKAAWYLARHIENLEAGK